MRLSASSKRSDSTIVGIAIIVLTTLAACEKVSHENIDKWVSTQNGPEKLRKALASSKNGTDLRAHAAQRIISKGHFVEVREMLTEMPESDRHAILAKLAPRLWDDAKIAEAMATPSARQSGAKDALFELHRIANETTKASIEGYLIDWYTSGHYEGRAKSGRISGRTVIRLVGEKAGPKLLEATRAIIAKEADAEGNIVRIGDELLRGLAYSGHTEALILLLDVIGQKNKDESLAERALARIHEAFVEPSQGIEPVDGKKLIPVLSRLVEVAKNEELSGTMNNDAMALVEVVGSPECIKPFVELVAYEHSQSAFRWQALRQGASCGGAEGFIPIVDAVPSTISYERGILDKYLWKPLRAAVPRGVVAKRARSLLSSKSWVARITGIELLRSVSDSGSAGADAVKIRKLARDKTPLKGWYGKQQDVAIKDRKRDPTLGQVAVEVANHLEGVAKGRKTK